MIDLLITGFAGFAAFLLGLLRYLPLRHSARDPEQLLAILSVIALIILVAASTGLLSLRAGDIAGLAAFYIGSLAAYSLSRFFPRLRQTPRERFRTPAEYLAHMKRNHRPDKVLEAMRAEAARGIAIEPDDPRIQAFTKAMADDDARMAQQARRLACEQKALKLVMILVTAAIAAYVVIGFLTV